MSVRLQWTFVALLTAALFIGTLLVTVVAHPTAETGTGTVRTVIGAGTTDQLVDVALIDASGHEYAGDNRGAGESETLQQIPAGHVQVNVGVCSTPAVVRPGRTVVVRFDPVDCIR